MDPMQQQAGTSNQGAAEKKKEKKKKFTRIAANTTWEDDSLAEWEPSKSVVRSYIMLGDGTMLGLRKKKKKNFKGKKNRCCLEKYLLCYIALQDIQVCCSCAFYI